MIRNPVAAGQFYSGSKETLLKDLSGLIPMNLAKVDAVAVISPHAGYIYSGGVAGNLFGSVRPKDRYIIMGPNHYGSGAPFALSPAGSWKTPLGNVEVDEELAALIKRGSKLIKEDELSHSREHSIEVQLPFLQYLNKKFKFVPISISDAGMKNYREVAHSIAAAVSGLGLEKDTMIIASSDMTHYEPRASAEAKDRAAIEAILKLDEAELAEKVSSMDITMCGRAPAAIAIIAAKELGAKKAALVRYATSGDASGDYSSVVGYAGIAIT